MRIQIGCRLVNCASIVLLCSFAGCIGESTQTTQTQTVVIDGSSTVEPISTAVAESFATTHSEINVRVNTSGTSAGFEKFARGETDISDASRPIKDAEIEQCTANGVEPIELTVAIDGLSVVVNKENTWCDSLTVEQLKMLWEHGSEIESWSQLDPSWPDHEIVLYGPDDASGTYDYFIEAILGKEGVIRDDYSASADDNTLADGVKDSPYALGFFGYAYYTENADELNAIGIAQEANEPVAPNPTTIEDGTYAPLSRRLFIYVNKSALERPEVREFVEYYLSDEGIAHVTKVGYVSLPAAELEKSREALQSALAE